MIPSARAIVPLVLSILSVILSGCTESVGAPDNPVHTIIVRVAPVTTGEPIAEPLRFAGIVRARQRATLTFQVSGTLRERRVGLGEKVEVGQVLATLYNPALEPARDFAEARLLGLQTQLDQVRRESRRSRKLLERGVVSEQALEQVESRRDSLEASVTTARAALTETRRMVAEGSLTAPFAGRVEALLVEEDEFVNAGQPVLRISSPTGREVEVRVPAYLLDQVHLRQQLPVWSVLEHRRAAVTGTIIEIAQPSAMRGELHALLVSLPDGTLEAGVPVEVGIATPPKSLISVPLLSVIRFAAGTSVFRVVDGGDGPTAERVSITVERIAGEQAIIGEGSLKPGDRVVYAGMTRVTEGDAMEILP